jgi:UDPglucose 6-dehydrogenase
LAPSPPTSCSASAARPATGGEPRTAGYRTIRRSWPQLDVVDTAEQAADRADAVLVLRQWKQYRELDPASFGQLVKQKCVLDGRNALDREAWTAAGWAYRALGRRAG